MQLELLLLLGLQVPLLLTSGVLQWGCNPPWPSVAMRWEPCWLRIGRSRAALPVTMHRVPYRLGTGLSSATLTGQLSTSDLRLPAGQRRRAARRACGAVFRMQIP